MENKLTDNDKLAYKASLFVDEAYVQALHYPEKKIMHFVWKGRASSENYRNAFLKALDYADTHKTSYFISDIRNQGVIGPEDRKWFESVAMPGAIDRGLIKAAIIFDGNVFKRYYINILLQSLAKRNIPMKLFNDLQSAERWLLNK